MTFIANSIEYGKFYYSDNGNRFYRISSSYMKPGFEIHLYWVVFIIEATSVLVFLWTGILNKKVWLFISLIGIFLILFEQLYRIKKRKYILLKYSIQYDVCDMSIQELEDLRNMILRGRIPYENVYCYYFRAWAFISMVGLILLSIKYSAMLVTSIQILKFLIVFSYSDYMQKKNRTAVLTATTKMLEQINYLKHIKEIRELEIAQSKAYDIDDIINKS